MLALKVVEDIYLQAGEEAVLLLHSFTSNANEMRKLAQCLHAHGYTCYAPNLAGHGAGPASLFNVTMEDIATQARDAVERLIERGMKHISIIGQSLGGVLAIHLAEQFEACKAIGIISSPVIERPIADLQLRVEHFSKRFLSVVAEEDRQVFFTAYFPRPKHKYIALQQYIVAAGRKLHTVQQPVFLAKGLLDEVDFHNSIDQIEATVVSPFVVKKEYTQSGHLITLSKERTQLQDDIVTFLASSKMFR